MHNDFEAAAAHLLPYHPVAKKRASTKHETSQISDDHGEISSKGTMKSGIGKTGVDF